MIKNIQNILTLLIGLCLAWLVITLWRDSANLQANLPKQTAQANTSKAPAQNQEDHYQVEKDSLGKASAAILHSTDSAMAARQGQATEDHQAPEEPTTPSESKIHGAQFIVVAGSYRQASNAEVELKQLKKLGFSGVEAAYLGTTEYLSVIVDHLAERSEAEAMVKQLERYGVKASVQKKKR